MVKKSVSHQTEDCNEAAVKASRSVSNSTKECENYSIPGKQVPQSGRGRK